MKINRNNEEVKYKEKTIKMNPSRPEPEGIRRAVAVLRSGGVVIFPTDTVYGMGVLACKRKSIKKIYSIKKRDFSKPLVLLVAGRKEVCKLAAGITEKDKKLMKSFWPGALTIIFSRKKKSNKTIGLRMPANSIALEILRKTGSVATTSVNLSGKKAPSRVIDIDGGIKKKADLIIDGGRAGYGVESTVIDVTGSPYKVLREGCINKKQLESVVGQGEVI